MTAWIERLTEPSPTNEPPSRRELQRNDLLVAALVLFSLFLALGIRNQVLQASRTARLGDNLPSLAYPARWHERSVEGALFAAINPGSPSTFDSQVTVTGRPLRTSETLEDARADRGIKLATTLPSYRELEAERMTVFDDQPALVSTYGYVADPTHDAGAIGLPVVVQAQDIMFLDNGQFMVVTLAADSAQWDNEQTNFGIVANSLKLKELPERNAPVIETPTPLATPPAPSNGDVQPGSAEPGSAGGSFSSNGQGSNQAGGAAVTPVPTEGGK